MKIRPTVIPAVHLFFVKDDQVLLCRRFQTGYEDGNYSVPAGHIEVGETALQAGIREAKEEVGVDIDPTGIRFIHIMNRKKPNEEKERVDFFFEVTKWEGEIANAEPTKCDDVRWFSKDKLPDNVVDYVEVAFREYENNHYYSHYGFT